MSRDNVWFPLYVGDYLADTMHLTAAEHGAYLLLLMHSWRTGPLPDNDKALAAITRCDAATWRRIGPTVRGFFTAADGVLVQGRLEQIRADQVVKIEQRRAAGKASAEARERQRKGNDRSTSVAAPLQRNGRELELELKEKTQATPVPPAGGELLPIDARTAVWREGVPRLMRLTGKSDRACRTLLGRLLQSAGDDCPMLASVLHEAEATRPVDPEAWIVAAIQARTGRRARPSTGRPSPLAWMADDMRASRSTDPDPFIIDMEPNP